jgi:hypothetical protein
MPTTEGPEVRRSEPVGPERAVSHAPACTHDNAPVQRSGVPQTEQKKKRSMLAIT